ncbi:hypothetical protein BC940DRAFT_319083 [Gongronella butleri]|nr:hypothetical protein BC940DRAFT_319083 [Gongronella butleri]
MRSAVLMTMLVVLMACLVHAQGVSRTGKRDGARVMSAAKNVPQSTFHIRNYKTKRYLAFLPGTLVEPTARSRSSVTKWTLKRYQSKLYSINHDHGSLKKCISARWTNGRDDAAVMWQCELKYKKRDLSSISQERADLSMSSADGDQGLEKRYAPIDWRKQVWLLVPVHGKKNTFKIMAYTHLYDMIPTCLSSSSTGGTSSRGGTVLKKCQAGTKDPSLYWTFYKA